VKKVIGPSLLRLSGKKPEVSESLKCAYRDNNKSSKMSSRKSKSACIADDVSRIIGAIPDLCSGKPEEASIILFALYSGARAISAVNVLIEDMNWKGDVL
jgi:hypothetical protein